MILCCSSTEVFLALSQKRGEKNTLFKLSKGVLTVTLLNQQVAKRPRQMELPEKFVVAMAELHFSFSHLHALALTFPFVHLSYRTTKPKVS